ncbi:hypothetical protein AQUCO_05500108v1 [Aquilegia coerulea]|uniref:Uncharacterized protein n=1 Tax=Aquilegia coerulea TaxID=218851 RepID=A0A2G5CH18_AQUCA|nr:hypothetical protein AQUCO_05500108v1 [Aquilegia coerulea]
MPCIHVRIFVMSVYGGGCCIFALSIPHFCATNTFAEHFTVIQGLKVLCVSGAKKIVIVVNSQIVCKVLNGDALIYTMGF